MLSRLCLLLAAGLAAAPSREGRPDRAQAKPASPERALKAHIAEKARYHGGLYRLEDADSGRDFRLKLLRLDASAARSPSKGRRILRADFLHGGAGGDTQVSVDFTLRRQAGAWRVVEEAVSAVDGEPRFAYSKDHRRVPVGAPRPGPDPSAGPTGDPFLPEGERSPYAELPQSDPFLTNPDGTRAPSPPDPFVDPQAKPEDPSADPFAPPR